MKRKFVIADQNAVSAEGHFRTYTNALALAAHESGHDVTVLWNKRFPLETISAPYDMALTFSHTEGEAGARGVLPYGEGHFGYELGRALAPLRLSAQDLVVIHTCHFVELVEALDYFTTLPPARSLPIFHVVVRYDPDVFQYRMRRLIRQFDALSCSDLLREKFRFHSDTEQLAAEFGRLFGVSFGVCPIPIDLARLLPQLAKVASRKAPSEPLIATYLGTARTEKGYRDLADAIAFLAETHIATDRLHFVLQCSERSLQSEPGLLEYQARLEDYLREHGLEDKVRLVKEVVDSDEYCALVAQSDIILLAYSPISYRCRSSSVLVEAMAAGKVVVTTCGSWMASRVAEDHAVCYSDSFGLGPAIAHAVDRFEQLAAGAVARRQEAIAAGDPAALARYFAQCCSRRGSTETTPIVLAIADGDAIASARSRSRVFLERVRYCDAAGYRVVVLALMSEEAADAAVRRRVADALRAYALEHAFVVRRADLANASRDEIAALLSDCAPGCVLLSCASDYELVEMLGLAERPIICQANGGEAPAAASGASLLFVSAHELEAARKRNPGLSPAHCAFPFALLPSRIDDLAGPVNGFELVASADPFHEFGPESNSTLARSSRYSRLSSLKSVDLLILGSPGDVVCAEVRWFLEEVYGPFLSSRGLSAVIAGEAGAGSLPSFDDVFFVGPVAERGPFYAAAKIVVALDRAGDESSLDLLEALAKGRPVVSTKAAAAAIGAGEGLQAHDDAKALAEAIVGLLDSPERRARASAASIALAERLGAGPASVEAMNELFRASIGDRAMALNSDETPRSAPDAQVEWSPALRAANAFMRSYIAGEPLEGLAELARLPDQGSNVVRQIAESLLERRSAPILRVEGGLLAGIAQMHPSSAAEAARVLRVAQSDGGLAAWQSGEACALVVLDRRFEGVILGNCRPTANGIEFRRRDGERSAWAFASDASDAPQLCGLELRGLVQENGCVLSQRIPIARGLRVLGRRAFANWRFTPGDGGAEPRLWLSPAEMSHGPSWPARVASYAKRLFSGRRSPLNKWSPWAKANPLFDPEWYLAEYPRIVAAPSAAFRHYDRRGVRKGYDPNPFFDTSWYFERWPEVEEAGENPLDHYLHFGASGDHDPGPFFSGARYLDANPDVRGWRLNPLLHYLEYGRREGRDIFPAEPSRPLQSIVLPAIIASHGTPWIEIEVAGPAAQEKASKIDIYCGERRLDLQLGGSAERASLRSVLLASEVRSGLVWLRAALADGVDCGVAISGLRVGWSFAERIGLPHPSEADAGASS